MGRASARVGSTSSAHQRGAGRRMGRMGGPTPRGRALGGAGLGTLRSPQEGATQEKAQHLQRSPTSRRAERCPETKLHAGVVAGTARGSLARGRAPSASCRVVEVPYRSAEGDRRIHRREGQLRILVRQALRGQAQGSRVGPVHSGEFVAPPGTGRGRERRSCGPSDRTQTRLRSRTRLRFGRARQPAHGRRSAGAQGRQDRLFLADGLAGRSGVRGGPLRQ